ncbi:hypothetical protein IU487_22215 [Nocardia puris]|uniref:hypothetical protein n=1 Tax=Nocardia puris TaxID=208602 RepID=UPI0018953A9E|nr:hypothetical protein [Nocardia puris]MBF6213735.1 hypothetical protein [Nocardia puris]
MPEIPPARITIDRYTVSCLPEDHPELAHFTVDVEYRGRGRWAVARYKRCYDADGREDWEPIPSERTDEWLDRHRHDLDAALDIARRVAPTLTVNGHTVADVLRGNDA